MDVPLCPVCGALSSWRAFPNNGRYNSQVPDECHYCKREEEVHWRQWWQGIAMTEEGCSVPLGTWTSEHGVDTGPQYDASNR